MSPLVALLALACAAPLLADRDNGQCTSVMTGRITDDSILLPTVSIPINVQNADIEVINACEEQSQSELVGARVTVCDESPPAVVVPDPSLSEPIHVHRFSYDSRNSAEAYVIQYCES